MKTPEDEAFDDLARKQGDWGGGFKAKQAMAADKVQEPWNEDEWRRNNWRCSHGWLRGEQCESCNAAQEPTSGDYALGYAEGFNDACKKPAQEPVGEIRASSYGNYPVVAWGNGYVAKIGDKFYTTPPQRERVVFPTMLRKMWSGGEVQAWLDENVNKEKNA